MPGSLVDLSQPGASLPSRLVLDSSVILDWLTAISQPLGRDATLTLTQHRAIRLFGQLRDRPAIGLVTATGLSEVFHVVLKIGYRAELPHHRADLLARYPNVRKHGWEHLFKTRPDLVGRFAEDLTHLRTLMRASNLVVLQPADLGPIPSGRSLDDALVRTMARYELDSNDAAILLDAHRAGIPAVASSDADFRRARLDFDVYTWL